MGFVSQNTKSNPQSSQQLLSNSSDLGHPTGNIVTTRAAIGVIAAIWLGASLLTFAGLVVFRAIFPSLLPYSTVHLFCFSAIIMAVGLMLEIISSRTKTKRRR
jgi:magnesium-transporting ATPase (P-type)